MSQQPRKSDNPKSGLDSDRAGEKENEQPIQPRMDADGHSAAEPQPKKWGHEKHKKPQKGEP